MKQGSESRPIVHLDDSQLKAFTELADILICPLCGQFFVQPVTLECQHTFCNTCVSKKLLQDSNGCPTCHHPQQRNLMKPNTKLFQCVQSVKRIRTALTECGFQLATGTTSLKTDDAVSPTAPNIIESTEAIVDDEEVDMKQRAAPDMHSRIQESGIRSDHCIASPLPPNTQQIEEAKATRENLERRFQNLTSLLPPPERSFVDPKLIATRYQTRVFVTSSLSGEPRFNQLKRLIKTLGGATLREDFSFSNQSNSSAVLVGATLDEAGSWKCKPTPKYYWALSSGCWILAEQWLDECERTNTWVDENLYQAYAYSSAIPSTRRPAKPMLFVGMTFALGPFSSDPVVFTKAQCRALLELNGAEVFDIGGAEDDGSDVYLSLALRAALLPIPEPERVVIVGHPRNSTHETGYCSFCKNVYGGVRPANLRVIESAWIMLCLERLTRESLDEYELVSQ